MAGLPAALTIPDAQKLLRARGIALELTIEYERLEVPLLGRTTRGMKRGNPVYVFAVSGYGSPTPPPDLHEPRGGPRYGAWHIEASMDDFARFEFTIQCRLEEEAKAVLARLVSCVERDGSLENLRLPWPRDFVLLLPFVGLHRRWSGYDLRAA